MTIEPKTLYLDSKTTIHVSLDGPALRISGQHRPMHLFPLSRIVRVVANCKTEWSTSALIACADAAIPINFVDKKGVYRARLLGSPQAKQELSLIDSFECMHELGQLTTCYENWLRHTLRQARNYLLNLCSWAKPIIIDDDLIIRRINHQAKLYASQSQIRFFDQQAFSLLSGQVELLLDPYGLTQDHVLLSMNNINMVNDLTHIILWYLQPQKLSCLKHCQRQAKRNGTPHSIISSRTVATFMEHQTKQINQRFNQHMQKLHSCLLEGLRNGH